MDFRHLPIPRRMTTIKHEDMDKPILLGGDTSIIVIDFKDDARIKRSASRVVRDCVPNKLRRMSYGRRGVLFAPENVFSQPVSSRFALRRSPITTDAQDLLDAVNSVL